MKFEELMRAVTSPYWAPHPLRWEASEQAGIAFFAREGRVGMFNLSWLMLNTEGPPPAPTYRQRDLGWVICHAEKLQVLGRSLEHHAATLPLWMFCDMLSSAKETQCSLVLKCLLRNGLKKLEHDSGLKRTSR